MSRNRIVLASKIATVVLLLVLGITLFWAEARFLTLDFYVFKLAVCFLLFLSAFHWFFGAMRNLTTTQVRLIDYAYLGIAALGIFVLAMNQEEKRYAYRQVDSQNFGRRTIEKTIANLENSLTDLEHAACIPTAVQVMPQHCERVKELRAAFSAQKPREGNLDFVRAVESYLASFPPPPASDEFRQQMYRRIESARDNLKYATKSVEVDILYTEASGPMPPPEIGEPGLEIYGLFTWPFILVFAFALRITKTTIEVFDWAKK